MQTVIVTDSLSVYYGKMSYVKRRISRYCERKFINVCVNSD